MTQTNKLDYTTKTIVVSVDNIDELFAHQEQRRRIRNNQVKNLVRSLEEGGTFPRLSVNSTNPNFPGKYVIVDGNHREEALIHFFERNPTRKVEVSLDVYKLTTEEEEKEKFRVLNNSVTPSSDDMLQQYKNDVPLIKKILTNPRISIYGSKSKPIKMRAILSAYFDAIKPTWSASATGGMDLVIKCQQHPTSGANVIKSFIEEYENWFGEYSKDSVWSRTTALNVVFRLWYQNKNRIPAVEMQERMRKVINNHIVVRETALGGISGTMGFSWSLVKILNAQRKRGSRAYTNFILVEGEGEE